MGLRVNSGEVISICGPAPDSEAGRGGEFSWRFTGDGEGMVMDDKTPDQKKDGDLVIAQVCALGKKNLKGKDFWEGTLGRFLRACRTQSRRPKALSHQSFSAQEARILYDRMIQALGKIQTSLII